MIRSIQHTGPFIQVSGGAGGTPYIGYGTGPGIGNMRYNPNSHNMEVFDGNAWITMPSQYATVSLDHEAVGLLEWARAKRDEELQFKELLEQHPGVRDLKEKLDIMVALVTKQIKQGE
jgi:hypothetical protein